MNGKALADKVRRRWPDTKLVFMSGYSENILSTKGRLEPGVLLLNKPFRKDELAKMLRTWVLGLVRLRPVRLRAVGQQAADVLGCRVVAPFDGPFEAGIALQAELGKAQGPVGFFDESKLLQPPDML